VPRFALLKHSVAGQVHYDLLLERGRVLKTWSTDAPLTEPVTHLDARARFDHPLRFLIFEGPLSEGNGQVEAVDRGEYERLDWRTDAEVFVRLRGARYAGHLRLSRREGEQWDLAFLADPPRPAAGMPSTEPARLMRVGDVARRSGLSREVINSYAMFGLIAEAERSPTGHRLFGPEVLQRLKMVGLLKRRGYTLRDIREIFLRDK
jgi:hypothetical protein